MSASLTRVNSICKYNIICSILECKKILIKITSRKLKLPWNVQLQNSEDDRNKIIPESGAFTEKAEMI